MIRTIDIFVIRRTSLMANGSSLVSMVKKSALETYSMLISPHIFLFIISFIQVFEHCNVE